MRSVSRRWGARVVALLIVLVVSGSPLYAASRSTSAPGFLHQLWERFIGWCNDEIVSIPPG